MPKKPLFIVEGTRDEPDFLRRLYRCIQPSFRDYAIYEYSTTLHRLADTLFDKDILDEDIDILLVLGALEIDPGRKALLRAKYTDLFLVFDFEPHHEPAFFSKIRQMLIYYNDSADHGKLYIDYPMMQSYKHFPCLPDLSFQHREIERADAFHYKEIVAQQAMDELMQLSRYGYETFVSLAVHHLRKINWLIKRQYALPAANEYEALDMVALFDQQVQKLTHEDRVSVVNTCILILVDYNPMAFFSQVIQHQERYRI